MGRRLVREPEYRDRHIASDPKLKLLQYPIGERSVQRVGHRRKIGARAERLRHKAHRDNVARETGTAKAKTSREVLTAYARVEAEGIRHDIDVAVRNRRAHLGE